MKPTASVDGVDHPASDFAYVPDPAKPSTWKFPIFDKAHVDNATARLNQTNIPAGDLAGVKAKIKAAWKKCYPGRNDMPDVLMSDPLPTEDIDGVEWAHVCSTVDANGNEVDLTEDELAEIVRSSNELINTGVIKVPLRLGHNEEQKLLMGDGEPATGWLTGFRVEGTKLLADMKKVPAKLASLIKSGAYGPRSLAYRHQLEYEGKTYRNVPHHGALLGATAPAIKGMDDIVALYSEASVNLADDPDDMTVIILSHDGTTIEDDRNSTARNQNQMEVSKDMKKELIKMLNLSEGATDDDIKAAVTALNEKANRPAPKTEATTALSESSIVKLSDGRIVTAGELIQMAETGVKASEELHAERVERAGKDAIADGRITLAEWEGPKDNPQAGLKAFAERDLTAFSGYLTTRPVDRTKLGERGSSAAEPMTILSEDAMAGIAASGGDLATFVKHNMTQLTEEQQKDFISEHTPLFNRIKAAL